MKKLFKYTMIAIVFIPVESCVSVKAYQKMYLNDAEMELAAKKIEMFTPDRAALLMSKASRAGFPCY